MESKAWADTYYDLVSWKDISGRDMSFCQGLVRDVLSTTQRILQNPNVAQVYVFHDRSSLSKHLPTEFVELPTEAKVNEAKAIAAVLASKPPTLVVLDGCDSYAKVRYHDDDTWVLLFNNSLCVASRHIKTERGKRAVLAALVVSFLHEIGHAKLRNTPAGFRGTPPDWRPVNRWTAPGKAHKEESGYCIVYFLFKGYPHLLSHKGIIEALGFRSVDGSLHMVNSAWVERFLTDFTAPLSFYQAMTVEPQPLGDLGLFLDDDKARGGSPMETCSGVDDLARRLRTDV
jgi:hypothetical protein